MLIVNVRVRLFGVVVPPPLQLPPAAAVSWTLVQFEDGSWCRT